METEIKRCRSCNGELIPIIDLGNQAVCNFGDGKDVKFPLELVMCGNTKCRLLQLKHNAPPESMWNENYGYKSGINRLIRENLKEIVDDIEQLKQLKPDNYVIDIGSNDGTLLNYYSNPNKLRRIGFEPSINVAKESEEKGFTIVRNFFNEEEFRKITKIGKAQVITAISMFYDLDNPNQFLKDIKGCLDEDGIFIIQQNYLKSMLEQNAFCNICHEHRCYYSLQSLKYLLEQNGLEIFDVKFNDINGGSIRTYIKHKEYKFYEITNNVSIALQKDIEAGLDTLEPYNKFAERIKNIKEKCINFLKEQKRLDKKVYGCGASTRGNTILQYFEITPELMIAIGDANKEKWGKKTSGSGIPIVSPEEIKDADYQFVLIWHLFEAIKEKEQNTNFIVPMPEPRVIIKNEVKLL